MQEVFYISGIAKVNSLCLFPSINLVVHLIQFNFEQNVVNKTKLIIHENKSLQVNKSTLRNLFRYTI